MGPAREFSSIGITNPPATSILKKRRFGIRTKGSSSRNWLSDSVFHGGVSETLTGSGSVTQASSPSVFGSGRGDEHFGVRPDGCPGRTDGRATAGTVSRVAESAGSLQVTGRPYR